MAVVLLSGVVLAVISAQKSFSEAVSSGQDLTIAMSLAEEKLEYIKSQPFYQIVVTSDTALDTRLSPPLVYDSVYYGSEEIPFGGVSYTRRTLVEKVDTPYGTIANMGYPHPDTGLKKITVVVLWERKGRLRHAQVSSLKGNPDREPLNKTITGTVTDYYTGQPIAGVNVAARRNPGWASVTNSSGVYRFQATDTSMRVVANKAAYYGYDNGTFFPMTTNETTWDFQMLPISSRTVSGFAVRRPDLVISQVSPQDASGEYIELYNPSTFTISMTGRKVKYIDEFGAVQQLSLTLLNSSIPPNRYFLIVGSSHEMDLAAACNGKAADATYNNHQPSGGTDVQHAKFGGIALTDAFDVWIDSVGWGNPAPANAYTGVYYTASPGLGANNALIRKALSTSTVLQMEPPSGLHVSLGNAMNLGDNSKDFVLSGTQYPRNTGDAHMPAGGTAIAGAIISIDDPIAGTVRASATGYFSMSVATGTWNLIVATGSLQSSLRLVVPTSPQFITVVPTATLNMGFISGEIRQFSSPTDLLAGLLVQADPGGYQTTSVNPGKYSLALPPGEYFITGNPEFNNPDWNTATTESAITVTPGSLIDDAHLSIWMDGWISGQITAGGDGIGNVVVIATGDYSNGNSAVTDSGGNYTIKGLRLVGNPYSIAPVLETGQTTSPGSYTVTVTQGDNASGRNFAVTGLRRNISGSVTDAGKAIPTGVLLMASTGTINASSPPDIDFAIRSGALYYFQAFSDSRGQYSIPVPGGSNYNVVAWYIKDRAVSSKSLGPYWVDESTGTAGVNFTWP